RFHQQAALTSEPMRTMRTSCPPLDAPFVRAKQICASVLALSMFSSARLHFILAAPARHGGGGAPAADQSGGKSVFFLTIREFLKFRWTAGPSSGLLS